MSTSTLTSPAIAADWNRLADKALAGDILTDDEAMSVLHADDTEILALLHAAYRVRRHYFGNRIKLNMLLNAKSGHCPEDCNYCSQSSVSDAPIDSYPMQETDAIVAGARRALAAGASTYCIVCSGRGPNPRTLDTVIDAVKAIKQEMPLKLCACLGLLTDDQARRLKDAGVDRYNHNLNTSQANYEKVCTTHTYADRVGTVERSVAAGLSACSGIIVGMGETELELIGMARHLRDLGAESIPVNLLHPVDGTPMGSAGEVRPLFALKVLAAFRLLCPDREIRVAGGRESTLRSMQPLAFYAANSMFVGDYLTTDGQAIDADHKMIEDMGFTIERPGEG